MTLFLSNIGLALIWAILTGRFNPANLAFGFVLGYLGLSAVRRVRSAGHGHIARRRLPVAGR